MKKIFFSFILIIFVLFCYLFFFTSDDYYEYDASSDSECLSGESYDKESSVCYFDYYCETENECAELDKKYEQVLEALASEYAHSEDFSSKEEKIAEHDVSEIADETENSVSERIVEYDSVKTLFEKILPEKYLSRITKISENSDGPDGTLAYVEPQSEDLSRWSLVYDPVDVFDKNKKFKNIKETLTTFIHEYAHILMLNDSQVIPAPKDLEYIECSTDQIIINEGCAKNSSYIFAFAEKFWTEQKREEAYEAFVNDQEEDFSYDNYDRNPNDFVTEYAATNMIEDMAESFAFFVMRKKPISSEKISDKKILFFYSYSELISLRNFMRTGMVYFLERS